jgi:hypothetical protein
MSVVSLLKWTHSRTATIGREVATDPTIWAGCGTNWLRRAGWMAGVLSAGLFFSAASTNAQSRRIEVEDFACLPQGFY